MAANGATMTTENLATLAGPAVAGVILAIGDVSVVFAGCAAAYAIAAVLLVRVHIAGSCRRNERRRASSQSCSAGSARWSTSPAQLPHRPLLRADARSRRAQRHRRGRLDRAARHRRERRRLPQRRHRRRRPGRRVRLAVAHRTPARRGVCRRPLAVGPTDHGDRRLARGCRGLSDDGRDRRREQRARRVRAHPAAATRPESGARARARRHVGAGDGDGRRGSIVGAV